MHIRRFLGRSLLSVGLSFFFLAASTWAGEFISEAVLPMGDGILPQKGTVAFLVRLPESLRPDPARTEAAIQAATIPLVDTPLFSILVRPQREFIAIVPVIRRAPPLKPIDVDSKVLRIALSQLKGGQWYHMAFSWDTGAQQLVFFLNGIPQESAALVDVPFWKEGVPDLKGEVKLGSPGAQVEIRAARFLPDSSVSQLPDSLSEDVKVASSLMGEGRTLYPGPLDLSSYRRTLIYENDFRQPLDVVQEDELFKDGKRSHEPTAAWILEGNGKAFTEDGALVLETNLFGPPPRWDGEKVISAPMGDLVLWLNQPIPDGFLAEYTMEPSDSHRGLHILFFSTHGPDGKSIFGLESKMRAGKFGNYTHNPKDLLAYHISFWGSPYTRRGTSNLRKDGDFTLLSVGDDRIADRGQRSYQIRVLKDKGIIRAEVDGTTIIDYLDDGESTGPIFRDGLLGFRMMGDSRSIKIRDLKVWKMQAP